MPGKRFEFRDVSFLVISLFIGVILIKLFVFSNEKDPGYFERFLEKYGIFALDLPAEISFAGERVPMENFDVAESLDKELLINTYWQSQTVLFFLLSPAKIP